MALTAKDRAEWFNGISNGLPPPPRLARETIVGFDRLLSRWERDMAEYVTAGGSLLRVLSGPNGAGKSHLSAALQAVACRQGMLVASLDMMIQGEGDLAIYSGLCRNLMLPEAFLRDGDEATRGLVPVLMNARARLGDAVAVETLRRLAVPVPTLRDALVTLLHDPRNDSTGRLALVSLIEGDRQGRTLNEWNHLHPVIRTSGLKRIVGRRDARLWTETLLTCLRALGFPGVFLTLDEYDDLTRAQQQANVRRLRTKLDALAAGKMPGTFVLYLVVDRFMQRAQRHQPAVDQRLRPLLTVSLDPSGSATTPERAFARLDDMRELESEPFLRAVVDRMTGGPLSPRAARKIEKLVNDWADQLGALSSVREFVRHASQIISDDE